MNNKPPSIGHNGAPPDKVKKRLEKVALATGEAVAITQLRLQLKANGFTPIPNRDKRTLRTGWNALRPDEDDIRSWLHPRAGRAFHPATGLLIENRLVAIDGDFPDPEIARLMRGVIEKHAPQLFDGPVRAPERGRDDNSPKFMLFARRENDADPFTIKSRMWSRSPTDEKTPSFQIEIFSSERLQGKARRQVGGFGPHTVDDETGEVKIRYVWCGPSPADVPLMDLPVITKDQALAIATEVDDILEARGYEVVAGHDGGEIVPRDLYDLDENTRFDGEDYTQVTLEELEAMHVPSRWELRCSASFCDPNAIRNDRCIVGWCGYITVHDFATDITHRPKAEKPVDMVAFGALLRQVMEQQDAAQAKAEAAEEDELNRAFDIWEQCWAIQGTLAERYLRDCGVRGSEDAEEVLGFHAAYPGRDGPIPALVAVVSDAIVGIDDLVGVHVTALSPDGRKLGTKVIGSPMAGVIMLSPLAEIGTELAIAVGIENALSAQSRLGPIWALPNIRALAEFPVLPCLPIATTFAPQLKGIERLTIIIGNDQRDAVEAAAAEIRTRWQAHGIKVRIARTNRLVGNLDDLLRSREQP